jgi:hypothetical protein
MKMTRRGFMLASAALLAGCGGGSSRRSAASFGSGTGHGRDVALMHVDQIPTNAAHGTILALDDLVRDLGLQESDFAAPVWRAGAYEGRR